MNGEIENIELIEDNNPLNTDELFQSLFQTINIEQPKENLNEKRIKLIDLLEKNRIPIKLSDNNIISIMDSVFIHSPYNIENCESTNEIILNRVMKLMQQLNKS
jgi:hypothetical protein